MKARNMLCKLRGLHSAAAIRTRRVPFALWPEGQFPCSVNGVAHRTNHTPESTNSQVLLRTSRQRPHVMLRREGVPETLRTGEEGF